MKGGIFPIAEYRSRARQLIRQLRSDDVNAASTAAVRFLRLRSFADRTVSELLNDRHRIRLKHALAVIALEHGYDSWMALKEATEQRDSAAFMYTRRMETLLNRWFTTYEEARESLNHQEGFLFPYGSQFFVCEFEGIRELGLDPNDSDWERIGWDWVKPLDRAAWERLRQKRMRVLTDSNKTLSKPQAERHKRETGER